MRHRVAHRKLGRVTEHRISMLRNQATALFRYEHLTTTVPKAKASDYQSETKWEDQYRTEKEEHHSMTICVTPRPPHHQEDGAQPGNDASQPQLKLGKWADPLGAFGRKW